MRRAIIHISSWTNGSFGSSAETDRLEESPTVTFFNFRFLLFFLFSGNGNVGKKLRRSVIHFNLFFFSFFLFCYCSFSLVVVGSDRWLIVPRRQLLATPSLRLRFIFLLLHIFCFFLNFF